MYTSMHSSANTMGELQKKLDGISSNIANSNTAGYKKRETTFSDMLFQQVNNQPVPQNQAGRLTPEGLRVGTGAAVAQTTLRLDQGLLYETGRELDFALSEKDAFFQVQTVDEENEETLYTRDGSFYLTEDPDAPEDWTLVNEEGEYLLNVDGERMTVPDGAHRFKLQNDGMLQATIDDEEVVDIGQVELVRITKPQLLTSAGTNSFRLPDLAELGVDEAEVLEVIPNIEDQITQGSLEQSNVDLSKEMSELLQTQRHYSFQARAISQGDQMLGLINSVRG